MLSRLARLLVASALVVALTACPQQTASSVVSVTIIGGDRGLLSGTTVTLEVEVQTIGAIAAGVAWSSSDESVASVEVDGTLSAHQPGNADISATSTADPTKSDTITVTVSSPGTLRWGRQFGTDDAEAADAVATDTSGNVYLGGYTYAGLEGPLIGGSDAIIRSYDGEGEVRWTRQFGTAAYDAVSALASDAAGNLYAAGYTTGALEGANAGMFDAFVRSYDSEGEIRWTRQFGTDGSDLALGIATDASGNVYAVGYTSGTLEGETAGSYDSFVRSYDSNGDLRWTRQFGTSSVDAAHAIATDAAGNVYAAGQTDGALGGDNAGTDDAFIRSYDSNGNARWTRQFGTAEYDVVRGLATDAAGNVFAGGHTSGSLEGAGAGSDDAFIRSYDGTGELRWTRQFGTSVSDIARGIAIAPNGHLYVAGYTSGALIAHAGMLDAFVRSYGADGEVRWTRQFGTSSTDVANAVATDSAGNVYAVGSSHGALEGVSAGDLDVFIRSYGP